MKYQAHKGVSTEYPENTMPAYRAAIQQGYDIIELDMGVTKDQQIVMLHDDTINRTARHLDGSVIENPVCIEEITYQEALQYDFGIGKALKYQGTKLALWSEVLKLAAGANVQLKVDNKYQRFSDRQKALLFDMIRPYTEKVIMTCNTVEAVREAVEQCPGIGISYDGPVTEPILQKIAGIVPKEKLTVWLPLENRNTWWVTVEYANPENAALIKKYGSLGVWILSDYEELNAAKALGADVIETNGQIKPVQNQGVLTDMHTHSQSSHDSVCPVMEMCGAETVKGIQVMAVTDHCDVGSCEQYDVSVGIRQSNQEAMDTGMQMEDSIKVLRGLEIGEVFWYPETAKMITQMCEYDVIIGSVHCVKHPELEKAYSGIDFRELSMETIQAYLASYFRDIMTMLDVQDLDILAHLTCPLRYIRGKYGIDVDMTPHQEAIESILQRIIRMGVALEVNTSSLGMLGDTMPGREILKRYKELGGYLITVGSDAHVSANAASGIQETIAELKKLGFHNIYYYQDRKSIPCLIG